ncbi:MAG: PDZ domain-containing protein [Actinobacteria bacterium]|nr:PDZ domain-containing protein [Actinomycetota bacterium]
MRRLLLVLLVIAGATFLTRGVLPCSSFGAQPSCYVALLPGPTEDTLGLVELGPGTERHVSTGELLLTTVAVEADLDLSEWLRYAISPRVDEVPREQLFPSGEDAGEVAARNAALMENSQLDATVAALQELGYDFDTDFDGARVEELQEPSAVDAGQLEPGDVIVAVDGEPVADNREVVDLVGRLAPGDDVTLSRLRDGTTRDVTLTLVPAPEDASQPRLGVLLSSYLELPVDVHIDAGVIGGPSAGLMFTLGIIELLGEDDLTGGAVVAGTGTIDRDGRIGPIGGIRQKVLGATSRGDEGPPAAVFLVPEGNMAEAAGAPVERALTLVPVATLDDAMRALADIRAGRAPVGALALPSS